MTTFTLGEALNALLVAIGKPKTALARGDGDVLRSIASAIEEVGLEARTVPVTGELPPHGLGALIEGPDGRWRVLLSRPGIGRYDVLSEDEAAPSLQEALAGAVTAIVLSVKPNPTLAIDVKGFLSRHARLVVPVVLGGLLSNVMILVLPLFGAFVYDKVLGNDAFETLWAVTIGAALSVVLEFAARALRIQMVERIAVTTEEDIDAALYRNVLAKSGAQPPIGLVLDKYKQILASRDFISSSYLLAVADMPFLLLFLAAIAYVAGPLVLAPLGCGLVVVLLNLATFSSARAYEADGRRAGEHRISILADVLGFREAVVTTPLRQELGRRWRSLSDTAALANGRARYWNALAMSVNASAYSIAYIAVLVGGAYLVEERVLTSGGIMATTMLTSRAMATISSLVLLMTRYTEFRRALRELDALLPATAVTDAPLRAADPSGEIIVRSLSWRPAGGAKAVLEGIDLKIVPGEIVGLAGLPGAGKTTLLRLITGVEAPTGGQVLLDMIPVEQWNRRQLARAIGYKPQEAMLFEGSIEDNVRGGNDEAGMDAMKAALAYSGLIQAVERGELSLSTEVGPRGGRLSGGQRQMVALARAMLADPAILLLDEPSVGLDAQSEQRLAQHVASLAGRRTVVVCSHSRALLGACSRIIVLQGGRIVADGARDKVLVG